MSKATLEWSRQIKQEQDRAYQISLEKDRLKKKEQQELKEQKEQILKEQ